MSIWFAAVALIAAKGVPVFNDVTLCNRTLQRVGDPPSIEACIQEERTALNTLVKQWSSFSVDQKAYCLRLSTTGGMGTYSDLLTCLQDTWEAQNIRTQKS